MFPTTQEMADFATAVFSTRLEKDCKKRLLLVTLITSLLLQMYKAYFYTADVTAKNEFYAIWLFVMCSLFTCLYVLYMLRESSAAGVPVTKGRVLYLCIMVTVILSQAAILCTEMTINQSVHTGWFRRILYRNIRNSDDFNFASGSESEVLQKYYPTLNKFLEGCGMKNIFGLFRNCKYGDQARVCATSIRTWHMLDANLYVYERHVEPCMANLFAIYVGVCSTWSAIGLYLVLCTKYLFLWFLMYKFVIVRRMAAALFFRCLLVWAESFIMIFFISAASNLSGCWKIVLWLAHILLACMYSCIAYCMGWDVFTDGAKNKIRQPLSFGMFVLKFILYLALSSFICPWISTAFFPVFYLADQIRKDVTDKKGQGNDAQPPPADDTEKCVMSMFQHEKMFFERTLYSVDIFLGLCEVLSHVLDFFKNMKSGTKTGMPVAEMGCKGAGRAAQQRAVTMPVAQEAVPDVLTALGASIASAAHTAHPDLRKPLLSAAKFLSEHHNRPFALVVQVEEGPQQHRPNRSFERFVQLEDEQQQPAALPPPPPHPRGAPSVAHGQQGMRLLEEDEVERRVRRRVGETARVAAAAQEDARKARSEAAAAQEDAREARRETATARKAIARQYALAKTAFDNDIIELEKLAASDATPDEMNQCQKLLANAKERFRQQWPGFH